MPDSQPQPADSAGAGSALPVRLSPEQTLTLCQALPVPAAVIRLSDGSVLEVNAAWLAALGFERAEVLGRPLDGLGVVAELDEAHPLRVALAEHPPVVNYEIELRDRAGRPAPYLLALSLVAVDGAPCALAVAQNIQTQRQLENALAESVIRFRALFDHSRDAIGVAKDGLHAYVNPAYLELFGVSDPAELLGRPLLDFIAVDSRAQLIDIMRRRARGEPVPEVYETRGRRRDGAEFDMEVKASVYTLNGEHFTMGLMRDITARKQAEAAMVERLKEMTCLTRISQALSLDLSPAAVGQEVITALTAAMQLPDLAAPRLVLDGQVFGPAADTDSGSRLQAVIAVRGAPRGFLTVSYPAGRGSFLLPFEQNLVDDIARLLGLWLERHTEQLNREAILAVSAALRPLITRADMLPALLGQVVALLHVRDAAIGDVVPETGEFYLELALGHWEGLVGRRFPPGEVSRQVVATRQSYLSNTIVRPNPARQLPVAEDVAGVAVVPLVAAGQWVGAILAASRQPIDALQLRLLEAIADIGANALQRARLHEHALRRADEQAALYATARELAAQTDLPALLATTLARALDLVPAGGALVALYEPRDNALAVAAVRALALSIGDQLPLGAGVGGWVAEQRRPLTIDDYQAWDGRAERFVAAGFRAMLGVPLLAGGTLVGVLVLAETGDSRRRFQPAETELLLLLAGYTGVAIQNTRLLRETARRLGQVQALRQIDLTIASSLELHTILSVVLDQAMSQLEVDAGVVTLLDPEQSRLVHAVSRGLRAGHAATARPLRHDGLVSRVIRQRSPLVIPNLAEMPAEVYGVREIMAEGYHAYFAAPLIFRGHLRGVLELCRRVPGAPDPEWLEYLETLAGQAALAVENVSLFDNLQRSNLELMQAYDATIEGWSRALDLRDHETEGHSRRVTDMAVALAAALGLPGPELTQIRRGALLHDIGKMGVPDAILHKPGPLTAAEWVNMRRHPGLAYDLLTPVAFLGAALDIPYSHHERWDGTGYPRGLSGEAIPLPARIFAVVDVWDALTSDRPYRAAWPPEQARAYLESKAGIEFDPAIVQAFFAHHIPAVARPPQPPVPKHPTAPTQPQEM